jgi:hypothetical protein
LESFLEKDASTESWEFNEGNLVVVDLSDPFVDAGTACALFNICTGIFLEEPISHGRIIALDEAHKVKFPTSFPYVYLLSFYRYLVHDRQCCFGDFHGNAALDNPAAKTSRDAGYYQYPRTDYCSTAA